MHFFFFLPNPGTNQPNHLVIAKGVFPNPPFSSPFTIISLGKVDAAVARTHEEAVMMTNKLDEEEEEEEGGSFPFNFFSHTEELPQRDLASKVVTEFETLSFTDIRTYSYIL